MEIERVNDNTVKFFLSYSDIEERGFSREEVWYNREKSEELFWEMMDEVDDESGFEVEGPLWIQVHAMSGGIEVTVTRAQMNADGEPIDSPFTMESANKMFQSHNDMFDEDNETEQEVANLEWLDNTFVFSDFDTIIPMASQLAGYEMTTSLYSIDDKFYLHIFYDTETMDDVRKMDAFSIFSEYGTSSNLTIHRLKEYGNVIMDSDVFTKIQHYFGK